MVLRCLSSYLLITLTSFFFFSSRRRHTISVSAFLLNRSSDLYVAGWHFCRFQVQPNQATYQKRQKCQPATYLQEVLYQLRSEERRVGKECRSRWSQYHEKTK